MMCGTGHGLEFTEKRAKVFGMGWSLYTCSGFGVCVCRTEICDMKILSSMKPILHVCDMDIQQHSYNDGVKQSLGVSSFSFIIPPLLKNQHNNKAHNCIMAKRRH